MIISRTPVRIPIGGGGTDLPFFYPKFGGELVTATIDKYIYITVSKRSFHNNTRVAYSEVEIVERNKDIKNTRVREALKLLGLEDHLEITITSEVPGKSGLGGSSAFLVGLLKALHTYKGEDISSQRLAEEASLIEIEILKEPIGKQDQYASALGGINHLKINKEGGVSHSPINISFETIKDLEMNLHMFFTKITRDASEVLKDQTKSISEDASKLDHMKQIKEIGIEIKTALEKGNPQKFGRLMNVHWDLKTKTSNKISDNRLKNWYDLGLKNGALGGKVMGAGGGGFFLFYCDNNPAKFIKSMVDNGLEYVPFRFDGDGTKIMVDLR